MWRRCVALCEANGGHTRYWYFIVASLRNTCAIIMLSNQHYWYATPVRWMDYLGKGELLTNTDLWTIFERNRPFVYIEKVLDLWIQFMKNGGRNKSVAFIILFSICLLLCCGVCKATCQFKLCSVVSWVSHAFHVFICGFLSCWLCKVFRSVRRLRYLLYVGSIDG